MPTQITLLVLIRCWIRLRIVGDDKPGLEHNYTSHEATSSDGKEPGPTGLHKWALISSGVRLGFLMAGLTLIGLVAWAVRPGDTSDGDESAIAAGESDEESSSNGNDDESQTTPSIQSELAEPSTSEAASDDDDTDASTNPAAPPTTGDDADSLDEPPTEQERGRLVINGTGDTNLDPNYIPAFNSSGYEHAFSGLQDLFIKDDLTIVNFECSASDIGAPVPKTFTFNCDIDALPVMKASGVEVANLANNHGADWGPEALLDSKKNVAAAGIAPVGVGANADEAHEPSIFEINGWKVAVIGFGGVVPAASWLATDTNPGMADGDTIPTMVAAVEAADEVADLVIVTIHWGVELDTLPRPEDIARAEAMIDAGADAIFGHHPHRLQPMDFYKDRPIAWSLGNFVWPRLSDAGATSAIAQVIVEPDGSIDACMVPVFIESHGHPVVQVDHTGPCQWPGKE